MTELRIPPEQTFFRDPALDRMLGVIMALAAEVFVLRSQVRRLGGETPGAGEPEDADAFVRHLLTPILGEQAGGTGA